jgi:hypothetical protein
MFAWLVAVVAGAAAAIITYGPRRPSSLAAWIATALRALAVCFLVALIFDAGIGAPRPSPPLVALDASRSWQRGNDSTTFADAVRRARSVAGDSLYLFGDSARLAGGATVPNDLSSRVRPAAERALAAGRPLLVFTDGEIDDPDALVTLPAGSRVDVATLTPRRDAAVADAQAPRVASARDSITVRFTLSAGSAGAAAGSVTVDAGQRRVATIPFDSLAPFVERSFEARLLLVGQTGVVPLRFVVASSGDMEPRNDTLVTVLEAADAAAAVLVSSSPDLDARELAAVLRGTVLLPTRTFLRVAPNVWREDGALASVTEDAVRRAVREAPVVVLHGDTSIFGAPRPLTRGSLLLFAPATTESGEWYPTGAPISPLSAPLSGVPWDSLPPLGVSAGQVSGDFEVLETRRSRRLERRVAIAGWDRPRRVLVTSATGFWRWRMRSGAPADAFGALWGAVFDWLAAERADVRAAFPAEAHTRAGQRIQWRRGTGPDSTPSLVLRKRGGTRSDTLRLRFASGATTVETAALDPGLYDVSGPGGVSLLAVNESGELMPRRPTVRSDSTRRGVTAGDAPRLRSFPWLFGLLILALCVEWIIRRRIGLR